MTSIEVPPPKVLVTRATQLLHILGNPQTAPSYVSADASISDLRMIGLQGAGVLPVISMVLSEQFGRENSSRADGLYKFANLPFSVLCVRAAAIVYGNTGSCTGEIIGEAVFLGIATLLMPCDEQMLRAG